MQGNIPMDYYFCSMHIHLCCIGKTDNASLRDLIDTYSKRLPHYTKFSWDILPDLKNRKSLSIEQQKEKEGQCFLNHIPPKEMIVLLDEKGKTMGSEAFADYLEKKQVSGIKKVWFLIGGPYGFSANMYDRANQKIAFSAMTFSHQMIRLLLVEQLYRAFTILNNEPYHHR